MWNALLLSVLLQGASVVSPYLQDHAAEKFLLNHSISLQHLRGLRVWDREKSEFRSADPSEQLGRQPITVLHLWADYCVPCIDELPSLVPLSHQIGKRFGHSVRFLFVTETLGADDMKRFLDRYPRLFPPTLTLYQDPAGMLFDSLRQALPASRGPQLPATLVLDDKGAIRQLMIGSTVERRAELLDAIERLQQTPPQNGAAP